MQLKRVTDYAVYLAVRIFICIAQTLRMETCARLARFFAYLACDVLRIRHDVTEENLKLVYPEWSGAQRRRVTRRMWRHLMLFLFELAHVPRKIHETNWRHYITVTRKREMVSHLLDPRPRVIVSGHFGNFEVAGYTAGLLGFATHTIARTLDNPYLDRFANGFRESKRQFMLPKRGSGEAIQKLLASGGTILFLGDQYAGPKGCWVEFLGQPASCHKALAVLTLTGGAPLVVSYARRLDEPLHFEIGVAGAADPANLDESIGGVKELTQWYNHVLEGLIRAEPEQYWWVHRRWKGKPLKRKKKRKKRPAARPDDGSRHVA